jgi:hypothetical protein
MEIWNIVLLIVISLLALYMVPRILFSAIFRSYFELKKFFNTNEEDENGQKRS